MSKELAASTREMNTHPNIGTRENSQRTRGHSDEFVVTQPDSGLWILQRARPSQRPLPPKRLVRTITGDVCLTARTRNVENSSHSVGHWQTSYRINVNAGMSSYSPGSLLRPGRAFVSLGFRECRLSIFRVEPEYDGSTRLCHSEPPAVLEAYQPSPVRFRIALNGKDGETSHAVQGVGPWCVMWIVSIRGSSRPVGRTGCMGIDPEGTPGSVRTSIGN
ncbi:hypothetical protein BJX68DRAFT_208108 [Aspergillus pseudodeflectus]|uniref:Uncharacterized protein n=1 Tax=Aspergillus pseudodeflectus TaxID=176178 RepID=A0ABR4KVR6_9EURO